MKNNTDIEASRIIGSQYNLPDGWFHIGDIAMYRHLAESVPNNGTIIELGVWKGRSLCSIADIIIRKNLKVYAVDTFVGSKDEVEVHIDAKTKDIKSIFKDNIKQHGFDVELYHMTTNEASKEINEKFDLIFIDADHSYDAVVQDLENWIPKCKGVIAGHDYELDDVRRAVLNKFKDVDYIHSVNDNTRGTMWWKNLNDKQNNVMKKIDVIIPAFKAQNTIAKTISSIVMQSIVDEVTITIVNDSDDIGYKKFIDHFKPYVDIKEITLDVNGGPGVARQYGIDNTSAPYFTCIDADDTFSNAFALETLYRSMKANPGYHTVVGSFIEQHENLQFVNHANDLVWMFGKLYTREFITKYKVRFNQTRANEDNGFNTIIRLISSDQEKIMFLPDVVYFWHHKEDSITRINNNQYSYDQSFVGYTDNMIYAVQEAKKIKPFNSYVDMWAIQIMAQLYIYYYQTVKRDPRFIEQNYNSCKKYYKEVFKHFHDTMTKENFDGIFAETLSQQAPNMMDILPDKTIYQFIDQLKNDNNTI
jgi:glycosyltransferase involved in cell wall biosynthesis